MRTGLLIAGIILMVIGAAGYVYVQATLSDCQSFLGQLGRAFSGDIQSRCQQANLMQMGGAGLFVVDIGLTIGGAVAKSK